MALKSELVAVVAGEAGISKKQASELRRLVNKAEKEKGRKR